MQVLLRRQNTALHRLGRLENTYMPVAKKLGLNLFIFLFLEQGQFHHIYSGWLSLSFTYIHTAWLRIPQTVKECQGLNLFLTCIFSPES